MKKTITANISGSVFHIEEDAYNQLNAYLANIRQKFHGSPDADEIIADIEGRIAELFLERMKSERQVVTTDDVASIIQTMGTPDDYMDSDQEQPNNRAARSAGHNGKRKLYRDPDDRWLAGVISGIAAYFDTNVQMLRMLFIISLLLGLPIIIYVIAWIIIPKAVTNAEKLEMRGEAVTVENLKKMFDDGVDAVERGAKNLADKASSLGKKVRSGKPGNGVDRFFSFLGETVTYLFKAIAKILGFLFILMGSTLFIAIIVMLLGKFNFIWEGMDLMEGNNVRDMASMMFQDMQQAAWMLGAAIVALVIPAIWLISAGMTIVANKGLNRRWNFALFPLWLIAIGVSIFIVSQIGIDHNRDVSIRTEVVIEQPSGEVVVLTAQPNPYFDDVSNPNVPEHLRIINGLAYFAWVGLDVQPSPDSAFHLISVQEANGSSTKKARIRAKNISYGVEQIEDTIAIASFFSIPVDDRFRGQELRLVLQVPMGRAVIFDASTAEMIDDVDNVQNVYDPHMIGYTWTMTQNGLSNSVGPEDVPNNLPYEKTPIAEPDEIPMDTPEEQVEDEILIEEVVELQESNSRTPFNIYPLIGHIR